MSVSAPNVALPWWRHYERGWLRADLTAGLTAAAVVIPTAMAYAAIAGLPLQVGLYTAVVPMVIYALLGTSRPLSVSSTSTIAILTASTLHSAAPGGEPAQLLAATGALAIAVGVVLVLASLLRLGFIGNFISDPVLTGFKSGIGLVILIDQIPKLLGFRVPRGFVLETMLGIAERLPSTSLPTLTLAVTTLALLFALARVAPAVPAPLIAVALGIGASLALDLPAAGVATVGAISSALPALEWPSLASLQPVWPAAAGIALMSFTETIASARAFAARDEPDPAPNRELWVLGAANLAGGLVGAMPASGGTTQTAANRAAGARTQVAALVTAAVAAATLVLLAPGIAPMPQATLAAVVVTVSLNLITPAEFGAIRRVRSTEFAWALTALAGVVLLGTLLGILVAVLVSMLSLAHQDYAPPVYQIARKRGTQVFRPVTGEHPDDERFEGLLILRVVGRLYFANAHLILETLRRLVAAKAPRVVALDCSAVSDLEYSALKTLTLAEEQLGRAGVTLWLVALNEEVLTVIRRAPLGATLGRERLIFNLEEAVEEFTRRSR